MRATAASMRRQAASMRERSHRPFPVPSGPWVMGQTWERLAFLHWPVAPELLVDRLPVLLRPDLFEGCAWIGVTPFRVSALHPRLLPPPPGAASFPELNVRTYVTLDGRPGIFFLSLDAASSTAVAAARRLYRLPYFRARSAMAVDGTVSFESRRVSPDAPAAAFAADYRPTGPAFRAEPGSLEHWLTERYRLYTADARGRPLVADIHHLPWPLRPAECELRENTMAEPWGIRLEGAPQAHIAERQDVVFWPLRARTR